MRDFLIIKILKLNHKHFCNVCPCYKTLISRNWPSSPRLNKSYMRFRIFMNSLDKRTFNVLDDLTRLSIAGTSNWPIWQTGTAEALIPLHEKYAPNLKEFQFIYYFVEKHLLKFLTAHSPTLEVSSHLA